MREVHVDRIRDKIAELAIEVNHNLPEDTLAAIREALKKEVSPEGKEILKQLLENAEIAKKELFPLCQDTGVAVVFLEVGQDVHFVGGDLNEAINEGVRKGYKDGYLRKSMVEDPLKRVNTGDNTPAVVHVEIVPGDKIKIGFEAKGGGCENMSTVKMLKPSDGREGIIRTVLEWIRDAAANPCPPVVAGIAIGGTFEKAALLAKEALMRPLGQRSPIPHLREIEEEIFEKANRLGIGPQGFGGRTTVLGVNMVSYPCHIASMPLAINIDCHSHRHGEAEI